VKLPEKLTGLGVERARKGIGWLSPTAWLIEVGRDVLPSGTVGVGSQQQRVVVDHGNSGVRYPQLDFTLVPEGEVAFARLGVQRNELPQRGEKDAGRVRLASRPVGHPPK